MNEPAPKFQIGDCVAVFATHGGAIRDCIPRTVITDRTLYRFGDTFVGGYSQTRVAAPPGWRYQVADDPAFEYAECCLRLIDPDAEYQDEPERTREVSL